MNPGKLFQKLKNMGENMAVLCGFWETFAVLTIRGAEFENLSL